MHLSIRQFQDCYKVITSTTDDIDRLTGVCAIIHGGKAEDYLNKTPLELSKYSVDISVPEGKAPVTFYCQGKKFFVNHLISTYPAKTSIIDLSNLTKDIPTLIENMHVIMSLFTTHKPKWFGKAMNREQVAKWLQDHCDISVAYPTAVFFCNLYKRLQSSILDYSMRENLKLLKKQREAIQEALNDIGAGS